MISVSLIHMPCASVKLDADARPSLLMPFFFFGILFSALALLQLFN